MSSNRVRLRITRLLKVIDLVQRLLDSQTRGASFKYLCKQYFAE